MYQQMSCNFPRRGRYGNEKEFMVVARENDCERKEREGKEYIVERKSRIGKRKGRSYKEKEWR